MKILLINKFLYDRGGDTTYVRNLSNLLQKNGNEVSYWGMKHKQNFVSIDDTNAMPYIDFNQINKQKTFSSTVKVLRRSIYSFDAKKKIEKIIKLTSPDVAHINNIHSHISPSIIDTLYNNNVPIVWTLHDFELICPNIHFLRDGKICEDCKPKKYYMATINRCKKNSLLASLLTSIKSYAHLSLNIQKKISYFICPSDFMYKKFIDFGWSKEKLVVLKNFIKSNNYDKKKKFNDYILFFGGLNDWKGVNTLLRTAKIIPKIKIKIAGKGPMLKKLIKFKEDNKLTNVSFIGYLNGKELLKNISNASLSVVPSECYENCPYSILESYSLGTPVIGSNIGGIPELINEGKTGFLFEAKNHKELANKIILLMNNKNLLEEMSINCLEYANKIFSEKKYYNSLFNIYKKSILSRT